MDNNRKQLTLFIPETDAENIEAIRAEHNPRQWKIIGGHVTLCREDEIENIEKIVDNLVNLKQKRIKLKLGRPLRFGKDKGVLISVLGGLEQFQKLRMEILKDGTKAPRQHEPHITLMHPRNSTCTDTIFKAIEQINLPRQINFKMISLIQQLNGGRWKTLKTFELSDLNHLRNDEFEKKQLIITKK